METDSPRPLRIDIPPTPDMATPDVDSGKPTPYALSLRLALGPWTVHFRGLTERSYIKGTTMDMLDRTVVRKALERTRCNPTVREEIGTQANVWLEMGELINAARPSLERRCFKHPPIANEDPDSSENVSGLLIAEHSNTLLQDLARLNSVVAIARNVLTIGQKAQSLAAKTKFDKVIFELISVCVKITARGFDGDPGTQEEDRWQLVINEFKKVLITALQFLNNLVTGNERRKYLLWIQLFDGNPNDAAIEAYQMDGIGSLETDLAGAVNGEALEEALVMSIAKHVARPEELQATVVSKSSSTTATSSPFLLYIGKTGMDVKRDLQNEGRSGGAKEIAAECQRRWIKMDDEAKAQWHAFYKDLADQSAVHTTTLDYMVAMNQLPGQKEPVVTSTQDSIHALERTIQQLQVEAQMLTASSSVPMSVNRLEGTDLLQRHKDNLMKRIEPVTTSAPPTNAPTSPTSPVSPEASQAFTGPRPVEGKIEDSAEDESDDDDDYAVPGDDGRGLLTDVPLILGPTEIEVLPLLIMSGVVPPDEEVNLTSVDETNPYAVRCHLLLAQDNGRNLLRELLIFVAAWDLREEELYFKFMVRIMEAILANGLMHYAYHIFHEEKDIISPAQAVIMKLLTNIFRARQELDKAHIKETGLPDMSFPSQVEVQMVTFLFREFRRNIVPRSGSLIFMQGQIRSSLASPEDFPLNLWDMERMYEGIYQYLEFFAILTEHDTWKEMMTEWDMTSELVRLLRELDKAIPKVNLPTLPSVKMSSTAEQIKRSTEAAAAITYETWNPNSPSTAVLPSTQSQSSPLPTPPPPSTLHTQSPTNTGEAYKSAPNPLPPAHFISEVGGGFSNESPADEPSYFEWRNLKKLSVLVLSSLLWKSRVAQDQVRAHGGIEVLINCCQNDEHNPYIKEHAILATRFAVEGNEENAKRVREWEAKVGRRVSPDVWGNEVYEQFLDQRGQVGLRRKEILKTPVIGRAGAHQTQSVTQLLNLEQLKAASTLADTLAAGLRGEVDGLFGTGPGDGGLLGQAYDAKLLTKDPRDLAEMMQNMMRELPARMQNLQSTRLDAERAAVAKLDGRFES